MALLLVAVAVMAVSGLASLCVSRSARWATILGAGGATIGSAIGLAFSLTAMWRGELLVLRLPWSVPYGEFVIRVDALSAFFLIPIFGVSALSAIYGAEYLSAYRDRKSLGASWLFYGLLVASMAAVVVAANGVLFLVVWEVMSLSSYFLVTFEDENESVRDAGWTYLVATHLGTAFLLVLFILLGERSGSLNFDGFVAAAGPRVTHAGLLFLLAVVGFGTKAGFMPFHVWLPEAHPAAPSHVSAVMSGVMIKTGIYGLVRTLTFLGPPAAWWAFVLIGIGLTSGVLGVLFALAQHDLKRLLAYHSVENIGIIALGLGVGLLGASCHSPALMVLGFGGGLLHVLNHALFKGLLFLGAGSVLHGTGTREIDVLGGLLKRMPWTGAAFLVGAAAICGLPPLNGFISEFLIYLGAFRAQTSLATGAAVPALGVVAALALIGGLAIACFTKAFGIVFLGEPRTDHARHAHEAGWAMRLPMVALATGCVLIGLFAPAVVRALAPVVASVTALPLDAVRDAMGEAIRPLTAVQLGAVALICVTALVSGLRHWLLRGRRVETSVTWDCGYARPSARMQYTASSFAQPLTSLFGLVLRTREALAAPSGYSPRSASLTTETPDVCHVALYRPLFSAIRRGASRLRWLQYGHVQLYVLYIAVTLLVLLIWQLG
jgi:hydrogenase-4 component B